MTNLPDHIQRAVDNGIDPFEIMHGEILNLMIEFQDKEFEDNRWAAGYQDCLTDLRVLGYNILFAIDDKEKLNAN